MSGGLIQLIATGAQNLGYNIPRNLVVSYFTEEFQQNSFIMARECDIKIPEYLEIELSPNVNIENFKTICHKICLEIEMGGQKILTIPLRFMIHLKKYEICDNKIYITIPFNLFCNEIKLLFLHYHEIRFKLTNIENNFVSSKLISRGIFYDTEIRRDLVSRGHEEIIQQLTSVEITCPNPRNEFKYNIPYDGIHKGFYIECENVDQINEISLTLNRHNRFTYNRFLVRSKCVKINENLLYLPLNFDKSQQDRTPEGFEGSLNLTRIDTTILNIKLDNLHSKICIYGLGSNLLRYLSGMCGLAYGNDFTGHDYEEYNEHIVHNIGTPINNYLNSTIHMGGNNIVETIIYKSITNNDKLTCCISNEDISINARYMICNVCNNNYIDKFIKTWFRYTPHNKRCPMCRENWSDFNIYINGEKPELEILNPPITT